MNDLDSNVTLRQGNILNVEQQRFIQTTTLYQFGIYFT